MAESLRPSSTCLWRAAIQLTTDERRCCWAVGQPRATKRIVYTVILGLLILNTVYFLCTDTVELSAVLVSVLLAAAIAVLWIQPWWQQRRAVADTAGTTLRVAAYAEGLAFGRDEDVWVPWAQITAVRRGDLLVLCIDDQSVGIPRRALQETDWQWLLTTCAVKEETP